MIDFSWQKEYLQPVVALLGASLGFIVYYFVSTSNNIKNFFSDRFKKDNVQIAIVLFDKFSGLVFLGMLPAWAAFSLLGSNIMDLGLRSINNTISELWIVALVVLIFILNFVLPKSEQHLKMYPEMKIKNWNLKTLLLDFLGWLFYLLAYEFLFRGFLLFLLVPVIGVWPAIMLSTAFYALAHVPMQMNEALGAFPFGIVLCVITLYTGNIWMAFSIHLALAVSNNIFSVYHHPDMQFSFSKRS